MPSTTVHIPESLLEVVDARAKAQGVSRNRFILRALEAAVDVTESWDPNFLAELRHPLDKEADLAVADMLESIVRARSSKGPPEL